MSDNSAAKVAQSLGVAPGATASLDTTQQLQTLNNFLTLRTFVAGHQLSDADKTYFNALKASKLWGGNGEAVKAKTAFPHLLRWFEHLCHLLNEKPQAVAQPAEQKGVNLGHQGSFDAIQLENAVMGKVVTRFPPEPSGYLHAGHLKACLMNDFYARKYNGRLLVRFDDTNPAKARDEYVEAIKQDLKTLEIQHEPPTFTSDYFGKLTDLAIELIKLGKAYVDLTPKEEIKIQRNEGVESKYRNTTPEENLKLFQEMVNGTELGQKCVLRAKIDMQHTNRCLRDPAIVRCNLTPHYRQGSKYKAYPLYDFACPLIDSLEGVTHALRSNEYHDKNPLYYWVLDTLAAFLNNRPQIEDFSRLNFAYVLLSKRKLQNFVDKGAVDGWNDPRFPTIQGILRRGLTLQALREFVVSLGAAKTVTNMSMDKLWAINKQILDPIVPRYTAIETPRKVLLTVTNVPDTVTEKPVLRHKKNAALGEKQVLYSNKAWLEGKDVDLIKEGEEVTLMDWGNVIIKKKEVNGDQVSLTGEFNPSGNFKNTQKFTWVAAVDNLIPLTLVTYGYLITVEKIPKGEDFDKFINPQSKVEVAAVSIPNITELKKGDRIQLERKGYYICDVPYTPGQPMVLVNIPDGKQSEEDKKKEAEKKKEEQPKQAKGKAAKK